MPPSFIESPFHTKAEYEAWIAMSPDDQKAAWAKAESGNAAAEVLTNATASLTVSDGPPKFEPLDFPPARVAMIKKEFEKLGGGGDKRLPLKHVHGILFTAEEVSFSIRPRAAASACGMPCDCLARLTDSGSLVPLALPQRSEYDFDTWDTDLQATCQGCGKTMAWDDVAKFLKENL